MGRFTERVAIVTGGSRGIGAAVVARLASEGARVMIADLSAPDETGDAVAFTQTDVTSAEAVASVVDAARAKWGRLDILVNNAGIGAFGPVPDMEQSSWEQVFAVNSTAIFLACRAAIPAMREGRGAIVNIASISGLHGDYYMSAYNASKGAVVNFTRSLALECAPLGIRVNALCPGLVETAMTAPTLASEHDREAWCSRIPLHRPARPEEMANVVAFLASDDASYMTGSIVTADGGLTAHTGQPNVAELRRQREQAGG
ncbi:MAG: SDR family oxidoreductase [Novosphingobium sp.]|nr:SDR family oxidoreductase [Novosphingobium sp.]MCP5403658.1 SDR family oxidoreductase [Novosphingobium sp.]